MWQLGYLFPVVVVGVLAGCKDLTGAGQLPSGTPNPVIYNTASGAIGLRNAAVYDLETAMSPYLIASGLLTDELQDKLTGASAGVLSQAGTGLSDPLDERVLPEGVDASIGTSLTGADAYTHLQQTRGAINVALHALATYDTLPADTAQQHMMRGELYALEAYTEIQLADFFCSGVPLSTLDFQGDFTYQPGSSTQQVYRDALVKLDSALSLAAANDSVLNLARVLKGRVYLDLGHADSAALAVTAVPVSFHYTIVMVNSFSLGTGNLNGTLTVNALTGVATVSDTEGHNGLPYRSSSDPRSATQVVCIPNTYSNLLFNPQVCPADTLTFPLKYAVGVSSASQRVALVLASGVEARLIEAEAALQAGDASWLTTLNALRTTGTVVGTPYTRSCQPTTTDANGNVTQVGSPCPAGVKDTTWSPGTGVYLIPAAVLADVGPVCPVPGPNGSAACTDTVWYKGLRLLTDPGTPAARVALLFRERAEWLFLTGERQGDLRRLLRQYGQYPQFQSQQLVYPTGVYTAPGLGQYGSDVNAPIPTSESPNPDFHGCKDRNA